MSVASTNIARDAAHAFRIWAKSPVITLAALLILTIGTSATITIFSILDSLVFKPLPIAHANRVVHVVGTSKETQRTGMSLPDVLDFKQRARLAEYFGSFKTSLGSLSQDGGITGVDILEADADLFDVMGVRMAQGSRFTRQANRDTQPCEIVISWAFWKAQFGGKVIAGQKIPLDGTPCLVDGVLPQYLDLPLEANIWRPLKFDLRDPLNRRRTRPLEALALIRPGVKLKDFNDELERITTDLSRIYPNDNKGISAHAVLIQDWLNQNARHSVWLLFAAVSALQLIACGNVANLLLARSSSRIREVAVRFAVGANRSQLFQQLIIESALLALAASVSGLAISWIALRYLRHLSAVPVPRPDTIGIDWRVLLFALASAVVTALVFGALPAFRVSAISFNAVLAQAGGRISETLAQQLFRRLLIGIETVLATALLITGFLFAQSYSNVNGIRPGFDVDHTLTAYLALNPSSYRADREALHRFAGNVIERLKSVPGIQDATVVTDLPLRGTAASDPVQVEGRPPEDSPPSYVYTARVASGFHKTLGIPLLAGRDLNAQDDRLNPSTILVNATLAKVFFPDQNPIGKRLRFMTANKTSDEIVGVVGDTPQDGLEQAIQPEVYAPLADTVHLFPAIVIRTNGDPAKYLHVVEKTVSAVDSSVPVFFPETGKETITRLLGPRAFDATLIGLFAALATLLACGGIFAVIAYSTSQRTSEIAVRMACGATPESVTALLFWQGVVPALLGIAAGLALSLAAHQWLAGLLYGISALSWMSYAAAGALLAALSSFAAWLPARRASQLDPWRSLRHE